MRNFNMNKVSFRKIKDNLYLLMAAIKKFVINFMPPKIKGY